MLLLAASVCQTGAWGEDRACDPSAHPLPNVGLIEDAGDPGCPAGMAAVAGFCVDRYEASLLEGVEPGGSRFCEWSPYFNPGMRSVWAVSRRGAVPQGYLSGLQAARACEAAGKRLCTDSEWLRACRGEEGRVFPYGPRREPGRCNDSRARHPAQELFPGDPNAFRRLGHPCLNQLPASLAPAGERAGCVTPEGVYDLMGGLHEWTAAAAGTFRGGFYVDTRINGEGCLYRTVAHDVRYWDYSTGFRCCADRAYR